MGWFSSSPPRSPTCHYQARASGAAGLWEVALHEGGHYRAVKALGGKITAYEVAVNYGHVSFTLPDTVSDVDRAMAYAAGYVAQHKEAWFPSRGPSGHDYEWVDYLRYDSGTSVGVIERRTQRLIRGAELYRIAQRLYREAGGV